MVAQHGAGLCTASPLIRRADGGLDAAACYVRRAHHSRRRCHASLVSNFPPHSTSISCSPPNLHLNHRQKAWQLNPASLRSPSPQIRADRYHLRPRLPRVSSRHTHRLGALQVAKVHLEEHLACLVRVSNVLERLGAVASGLLEQDLGLVSARVRLPRIRAGRWEGVKH